MSYFELSRTGASCKQNRTYVMQLLECFGLDFESSRCVEDEGDLVLFKADFSGGGSGSRDELTDLFHIANTLFGEVFIYCGQGDGDTVSDGYSRHEEVYNPLTNTITIADSEYCYGDGTIFGKNYFEVFKDQLEKAARESDVPIEWDDTMCPATETFDDFCREFISSHGGLNLLGQRLCEEPIADREIDRATLEDISATANAYGYSKLARLIKEQYGIYETTNSIDEDMTLNMLDRTPDGLLTLDERLINNRGFILRAVKKDGRVFAYVNDDFKSDKEIVLVAVNDRYCVNLKYAADRLKNDREIVMAAVSTRGESLEFASDELKNDKEVVLTAIKGNTEYAAMNFKYAGPKPKHDRETALDAVRINPYVFMYVDEQWKSDKEIVLEAVREDGTLLQYADKILCDDNETVTEAIKHNGYAMEYASARLRSDREFVLSIVKTSGCALKAASKTLQNDREVVLTAMKTHGDSLQYAGKDLRNDKEVVLTAAKENIYALKWASEELRNNRENMLKMIRDNDHALMYAGNELQADRAFALAAIKANCSAFQWVSENFRNNREFAIDAIRINKSIYENLPWSLYCDKDIRKEYKKLYL